MVAFAKAALPSSDQRPHGDVVATLTSAPDRDGVARITDVRGVMTVSRVPSTLAMMDSGATVDCAVTDLGRIPGTFKCDDACNLAIGDSGSALASQGSWLHALVRTGANGVKDEPEVELGATQANPIHAAS